MRQLVFARTTSESNAILLWVATELDEDVAAFNHPYAFALVDSEEGILAGIVLHDYSGKNISMSTAIKPGVILSPRLVHDILRVPFNEPLDACRVTAFVDETNMRSVNLIQALGFTEEGRIRKHFGDRDALVFGLLKDEFDGGRYGSRYDRPEGALRFTDAESGGVQRTVSN